MNREEDQVSDNPPHPQSRAVAGGSSMPHSAEQKPSGSEGRGHGAERLAELTTEAVRQLVTSADLRAAELILVRRAGGGDVAAAQALIERHSAKLYGLAVRLTGNASDAEDVLQETFTGALRGFVNFEGRSSVRTWLTRILVTQVARWRRSQRVRKTMRLHGEGDSDLPQPAGPGSDHARATGQRIDVQAAINRLSMEHRQVIVLREFQGLSYDEIADVLQVPRGTVESRLHRARAELKEILKDYAL